MRGASSILTKSIEVKPQYLCERINSGKWRLEFLYNYKNCNRHVFECMIWTKNRKNFECQLFTEYSDIEYSWNDINKDREW